MPALWDNFRSGVITDNPLTSAATTANSSDFANLPVVASPEFMWITLDPSKVNGAPEVVKVTAHTASSTAVTIARAQQGTVARSHPANTVWVHALSEEDAMEWVTKTQYVYVLAGTTLSVTLTENGRLVRCDSGSAVTITVPSQASVALDTGFRFDVVQYGAGQVTIAAGSGAVVRATPTAKTRAQYSALSVVKINTNDWLVVGDVASV